MIVDSSALIATVNDEEEAEAFTLLMTASEARLSVATWLEASIVADRLSPTHRDVLDLVVDQAEIELVAVTAAHARVAREAYRRFGRGSGSKARLNFGDCFAYALAIVEGDDLLFKGEDFAATDVRPAYRPGG